MQAVHHINLPQTHFAPIYQGMDEEEEKNAHHFIHNINLIYFDTIMGPTSIISIPDKIEPSIMEITEDLMDLKSLDNKFFHFGVDKDEKSIITFNKQFYIENRDSRGGFDILLLSFVIKNLDENIRIKDIKVIKKYIERFIEAIRNEKDINRGFLGNEMRIDRRNYKKHGINSIKQYKSIVYQYEKIIYYLRRFEARCIKYFFLRQEVDPFLSRYIMLNH